MRSKVKQILRGVKARTHEALFDAVAKALGINGGAARQAGNSPEAGNIPLEALEAMSCNVNAAMMIKDIGVGGITP